MCNFQKIPVVTITIALLITIIQIFRLFWIDYEGNPRAYFWLRPGRSDEYDLFIDHRWCIVDADTGKLLEVVVLKQPQTITIH